MGHFIEVEGWYTNIDHIVSVSPKGVVRLTNDQVFKAGDDEMKEFEQYVKFMSAPPVIKYGTFDEK